MTYPLISIIIPFYNVEYYIENCIRSVLSQTYANLEIILVDDGSKDQSRSIAETIIHNDSRAVIITRLNGGLSAARNTGLEAATGDFIFYLDSDDCLKGDCIEKLYAALIENKADIAQANFYYDYPDYFLYDGTLGKQNLVFDRNQAMWELLKQDRVKNFAWGKLIKAALAKAHPFEEGKYFEDVFWKYKIINECHRYVIVGEPLVYYLQRDTSISGSFSSKNLHQLEGDEERLLFIKSNYPDNYYRFALLKFKEKLLTYHRLTDSLKDSHHFEFKIAMKKYVERYPFRGHSKILSKSRSLFTKILRKMGYRNKWKKINK